MEIEIRTGGRNLQKAKRALELCHKLHLHEAGGTNDESSAGTDTLQAKPERS